MAVLSIICFAVDLPMRPTIGAVTRMDTPEQLSLQCLPVSPLRSSLLDLAITRDWGQSKGLETFKRKIYGEPPLFDRQVIQNALSRQNKMLM